MNRFRSMFDLGIGPAIIQTLVLLVWAISGTPLYAQKATGEVHGRVLDPTGRTVAGATIKASTRNGGVERRAVADAEGRFQLSSLPPAAHTLTALSEDFEAVSVEVTVA